jgi:hypothetical protein
MRKLLILIPIFLGVLSCSLPIFAAPAASPGPGTGETPFLPSSTPETYPTSTVTATSQGGSSQDLQPVFTEKQIAEEHRDPWVTVDVVYPYLEGVPRNTIFNQGVEDFINQQLGQFRSDADQLEGEWRQVESHLGIAYEVTYQSDSLSSILFTMSYYVAGAAHPGADVHSMNYDIIAGRFIELPSLFLPGSGYLEYLSAISMERLTEQGLEPWQEGVDPQPQNFKNWNIEPNGLRITFPPYQIAPGAAGTRQVIIPYNDLQEVIRPDGLLASFLN